MDSSKNVKKETHVTLLPMLELADYENRSLTSAREIETFDLMQFDSMVNCPIAM